MPVHLPPLSRRKFITSLVGGAIALRGASLLSAVESTEHDRWVLFSDIHVAADPSRAARGVNMAENLRRAVKEALASKGNAAGVFINGDCAYLMGEPGDYKTVTELLEPLRRDGLHVHITLGNHDERDHIRKGLSEAGELPETVTDKLASVVKGKQANWFLLDTLDIVNHTPGVLGDGQLAWLGKQLDAHKDKPAIVMMHHDPDLREKRSGLKDTEKLWEVLAPRKQVKALIYGHTHNWKIERHSSGIHQINLPPVAYVFNNDRPNGWVEAMVTPDALVLRLKAFDHNHREHGQKLSLKWRS